MTKELRENIVKSELIEQLKNEIEYDKERIREKQLLLSELTGDSYHPCTGWLQNQDHAWEIIHNNPDDKVTEYKCKYCPKYMFVPFEEGAEIVYRSSQDHTHIKCDDCNLQFEFSRKCKEEGEHNFYCIVCSLEGDN